MLVSIVISFVLLFIAFNCNQSLFKSLKKCFGFEKKKKRFDLFNVWSNDLQEIGVLVHDREWQLQLPHQSVNERVSIIGVNSWGQSLQLNIVWRPQTLNTSAIKVDFNYVDGKGNTYYLNQQNLMPFDKTKREYKAPGISLEILSPFRRLRIKFRGYLHKKGSNDLVFAKIRLLWLSFSNVFDFQCDHKKKFIKNEIKNNVKNFNDIIFENSFEQLGEMKGKVLIENQSEEKLFLWGNVCKKYEENHSKRQIYRLFGYSKKGLAFHIGLVVDKKSQIRYRFGFAFWSQKILHPIHSLSDFDFNTQSLSQSMSFELKSLDQTFRVSAINRNLIQENQIFDIKLNGFEGKAIFSTENEETLFNVDIRYQSDLYFPYFVNTPDLVIPLNDRKAENPLISGGKGSSLSSLNYMKENVNYLSAFEVPKGVVITTTSYETLLQQNKQIVECINDLKKVLKKPDSMKTRCEDISNAIICGHLPQEVKEEIKRKLEVVFGENCFNGKSFAVRSSASGEDSEEMSAAGQMTTYLGVCGLDEIYSSVLKCWSSQFSYVAVEYKRGYGQDINSPMAVVIQEMIDCYSAGVVFTCNPLSGDEREILITSNYGIGESVVSGMAEPDTIRVRIKLTDNSFNGRTVEGIKCIEIGRKDKLIKMNDSGSGGTVVVDRGVTEDKCCLSDDMAIRLADICLEIQRFYGSVRDIEWGLKDNQIYILQSRPVTNLDSGFTDYELMHELDSGLPSEMEFITRANTGEVAPTNFSALGLTYVNQLLAGICAKGDMMTEGSGYIYVPYIYAGAYINFYIFLKLNNTQFFRNSSFGKAMILALFGHQVDPDIFEQCNPIDSSESIWVQLRRMFYICLYLAFPKYLVNNYVKNTRKQRPVLDSGFDSSLDMFEEIKSKSIEYTRGSETHIWTTSASGACNLLLITTLTDDINNSNLYCDFALLMSDCGQLLSADIPIALRQLAQSIETPELFRQLSDEKALEYLMKGNNKSNKHFKTFLSQHGFRCVGELEVTTKTWREDPIPIIQILKTMLSIDVSTYKTNDKKSIQQMIDSLKLPLSLWRKMLLRYIVLPLSRYAVPLRETTKGTLVYSTDLFRQSFRALADKMCSEGLIPETDLLCHMTGEELNDYLKTRNPILIVKAKQRKRIHTQIKDWTFDEIISGYDFKPLNHLIKVNETTITSDQTIKGTAVSVGRVVARVCVATRIEEAINIKPGDILITYSTDIGWSPYFAMIGGIVTEIGGLVSHGAVIAREYGLPCLVGATGACRLFKTGDQVILDCNEGIVSKVENKC